MNGDDAIDILARRLRDAGSTAHSRTLLATVLTHCHRALNIHQRVQRATATLTMVGGRPFYQTSEIASDVGRIERVIAAERSLPEIPWGALIQNDPRWLRTIGDRPQMWARFGRTAVVITPAPWDDFDVTISYLVVPPEITDAATTILWPEELIPLLLDIAEGVMLCKARLYDAMDGAMSRAAQGVRATPGAGWPWRKVNL